MICRFNCMRGKAMNIQRMSREAIPHIPSLALMSFCGYLAWGGSAEDLLRVVFVHAIAHLAIVPSAR